MAYRIQVHLRSTNQTDSSRTTNINGSSYRKTRRGVRIRHDDKLSTAFVPWENVAYIEDLGPEAKV